jgi:hypothetical protein
LNQGLRFEPKHNPAATSPVVAINERLKHTGLIQNKHLTFVPVLITKTTESPRTHPVHHAANKINLVRLKNSVDAVFEPDS